MKSLDHVLRSDREAVIDVCGVLVHAHPAQLSEVRAHLDGLPGVQVHSASDDGRLVVTAEGGAEDAGRRCDAGAALLAIDRSPGVLSTTLVYQHTEAGAPHETASVNEHKRSTIRGEL